MQQHNAVMHVVAALQRQCNGVSTYDCRKARVIEQLTARRELAKYLSILRPTDTSPASHDRPPEYRQIAGAQMWQSKRAGSSTHQLRCNRSRLCAIIVGG
jgi:hypothetical protein